MTRDFFDPTPEEQIVVLIEAADLRKAEQLIVGCEACSEDAEIPFDNILDRVTGSAPSVTDYIMESRRSARVLSAEVSEKTLVEWV